jgi:hypothetical protein
MTDKPTKYFFRQRQQNRLYDVVIRAVEKAGMRRKELAEKLGVPPSQITRLLSGPSNWTSDTTSDLLFAVEAELDFQAVRFRDRATSYHFHPAGEPYRLAITAKSGTTATTSSGSVVSVLGANPSMIAQPQTTAAHPVLEWTNA